MIRNHLDLWHAYLKAPGPQDHKYTRGHVLILGTGIGSPGALRLAASAAARGGCGMVTLAVPERIFPLYGALPAAILIKKYEEIKDLLFLLETRPPDRILIGPSFGVGPAARETLAFLSGQAHNFQFKILLDADMLTSYAGHISEFKACLKSFYSVQRESVILTPHEGEFDRLFEAYPFLKKASKGERAAWAAREMGVIIVLKGQETFLAHPRQELIQNLAPSSWLASAGTGDVLSGLMAGLAAHMPAMAAAGLSLSIHTAAGEKAGPGLIADDLVDFLPAIWRNLFTRQIS